jgi:molecular chaperone GrpE
MEAQNADVPHGTVTQVLQAGYMIEDRVLRPAMVIVAKGGPKAAAAEQALGARPEATLDDILNEATNDDDAPTRNGTS